METILKSLVSIVAIIAICLIELYAIRHNIDGAILAASMALIGALAGNNLKPLVTLFKK